MTMWEELIQQVHLPWVIIVLIATALLLILIGVFFAGLFSMYRTVNRRFRKLTAELDDLPGCRIDNLQLISELIDQLMNPEFRQRFAKMVEDSKSMYHGLWVPTPQIHLTMPEILEPLASRITKRSFGFAVLLAGVAISTLALSSGFIIAGGLDNDLLRLLALLPVVLAAVGMLILHQSNEVLMQRLEHNWQLLMVAFERRVPTYSHAAETARMIFQMQEYDAHMARSVNEVAQQVQSLASGKMTDAVANAVKYVMSATVAPAVIKSTESLGVLVTQLDKQMQQADNKVAKLYTDLEMRQNKQSELWFKRYQEISEVLASQQDSMLKGLSATNQQMVEELGKSQKFALEKVVEEQAHTLEHVNTVSQKSWSILQEKLTSIITQLADSQTHLLTTLTEQTRLSTQNLSDQQQNTLTRISDTSEQTALTMRAQYDSIIQAIRDTQQSLWEQATTRQTETFDKLQANQNETLTAISSQQQTSYERVSQAQQEGLQLMRQQQLEAIRQLSDSQAIVLRQIDERQASNFLTINEQQTTALNKITTTQATAIDDFRKAQFDALAESARRQQDALQSLAENFGQAVSGKLAGYLDPISLRLHDASEALIRAQSYAADVQEVLRMQNEAATTLQASIGDLFKQLIETRKTMSEDLQSMKHSSSVMSKAAEVMGSVYEGSQAGLSEAISQMSADLMRLSNVPPNVMTGSAEQTQMMQKQANEIYETNQRHLDAVRGQITLLSDELATRIDQLMIGFANLTEDLIKNVNNSISNQNDALGGSLRSLTDVMSEEARSMSLFAQQINMDIEALNSNLKTAVSDFDSGMREELAGTLRQFDNEVADIVKRLARAAGELGDAVEALPAAIHHSALSASSEAKPAGES
ncbi:MAG TPA: hypothetical protein DCM45_07115 [Clostridiales bacterium]|nr:hypothetical protein [Clostridiales bacterium]